MFLKHRLLERHYRLDYLLAIEELTVRRRRPLARRRARTLRPSAVAMRLRKPCLLTRLRFEGWNVRFIAVFDLLCCVYVSLDPAHWAQDVFAHWAQDVLRCKVTSFSPHPQHPPLHSAKISVRLALVSRLNPTKGTNASASFRVVPRPSFFVLQMSHTLRKSALSDA